MVWSKIIGPFGSKQYFCSFNVRAAKAMVTITKPAANALHSTPAKKGNKPRALILARAGGLRNC